MAEQRLQVTFGNILSIATTLIVCGGILTSVTGTLTDLRATDREYGRRIDTLEVTVKEGARLAREDHDLIIQMNETLKRLVFLVEGRMRQEVIRDQRNQSP